jgi:hypothetical protein
MNEYLARLWYAYQINLARGPITSSTANTFYIWVYGPKPTVFNDWEWEWRQEKVWSCGQNTTCETFNEGRGVEISKIFFNS